MKTNMIRTCFLLCYLFLGASQVFSQGAYWESSVSGGPGEKERMDKAYYMPRMLKMVQGDDGQSAVIRLDKEMMIMIDPKEKTYWEISFDKMERIMKGASAQMTAQMAEMQKQLEQMPEDQRKMAEQMMGAHKPGSAPKIEASNTGETKTISGYACTKYIIKHDDKEAATVWATRDVKKFDVMKKDMEEFGKRMQAMIPGGKGVNGLMGGIDGFPIQTETVGGRKTVVTKIEERSTPADEFEAPAGYRKTEPPMMGGKEGEPQKP